MELTFVDELPEPRHAGGTSTIVKEDVLRALKENPGRWAVIATSPKEGNRSSSIITAYKRVGCQANSRKNTEGNIDVWASWPEKEEDQ